MKNLLRFLAFVLMVGGAYAQSKLPACRGSDASRWSSCFGEITKDDQYSYSGDFLNGRFQGLGTMKMLAPNFKGDKYVGEFSFGKLSGQGTYTFKNGSKYVGNWHDNKQNGQGTFTLANGNKYVGEFKDGRRNGQGTFTLANGNKYVGEFKDDKYNGQGTFTFTDGTKYVGEFKDGKANGQGTTISANGTKHVGEYKDDSYNGQGTFTFANGNKYVGEFKDDKPTGQGTLYSLNGSVINQGIWVNGNFVNSVPVKQATAPSVQPSSTERDRIAAGSKLPACPATGYFSNCFGTFVFPSGERYVGEFRENLRHGQGAFYTSSGLVVSEGLWSDGKLVRQSSVQLATSQTAQTSSAERDRLNAEIELERKKRQELEQQLAASKERERITAELDLERKKRQELEEQLKLVQQQPQLAPSPVMTTMANRKALVIGNDSYKSVSKLLNAREDAKAIASSLISVGYQVTLRLDLNEKDLKSALRAFANQVQGGDEVLFFFAGHGVQLGSTNYLLPIDIGSESEAQVKDEAIQLQRVLDDMTEKKAKFTLAMIDACRDNPFKSTGRNIGGRGLAPTTAATGQMVVFSAGTGQQALDRLGNNDKSKNGVFTRTFLKEMQKPGVSIDRIVKNVRNEVAELARTVGHEQVPAIYDQVLGDFYFKK
jgi:hypothetical protein